MDFTSFGNIKCTLVLNSLDLGCTLDGNVLYITGLTFPLLPGTQRIKLKNIYNPYIKGLTNKFIFESLQPGINTVVEYYEILGVSITPGLIKNPVISAYPLNKNLYIDYTISFTPTNIIPAPNGFIKIVFPPEFGALASTCRVIIGLSDGVTPITCPVSGHIVTIQNFATATPQFIQIKVFATNPSISGTPTSQFTITSYKSTGFTIDENLNAGTIIVQDIDKPYYLYIDLYTPIINSTFSDSNPLDFRLYPQSTHTLPATTNCGTARVGSIYLQIPLWWKNYGGVYPMPTPSSNVVGSSPLCYFGDVPSPSCTHSLQLYQIQTPATGDASRYSTSTTIAGCPVGLGECDVPISIENVMLTPIPGRWDFRVLTFIDQTITPTEQDLYTMDIPYLTLTVTSLYTTSIDQSEVNTVIRAVFNVGLDLPWEGAINFNLTVEDDVYSNSARWPYNLGFTSLSQGGFMVIPCRIKIGTNVEGFTGSPTHPNAKCFLFAGTRGTSPINTVIQVRGFSQKITSGTTIEVDIPDVTFCATLNMNCYIVLTTSFTTSLDNPYTLNYYRGSMGVVTGNSIYASTLPIPAAPTFSVALSATEVCLPSDFTFTMKLANSLVAGDHVLIKFPNGYDPSKEGDSPPYYGKYTTFAFSRSGITSPSGQVDIIYNFLTDTIYYLIKLSISITAGSNKIIILKSLRNVNYDFTNTLNPTHSYRKNHLFGITIQQLYWANKRYAENWNYTRSPDWTDGGITGGSISVLPATRTVLDFQSWINYQLSFKICHQIPSIGAVKINLPFSSTNTNFYANADTTCVVWSGLSGQPIRLTNKMTCVRNDDYFLISGFQTASQFQIITVVFKLFTKTTLISSNPIFTVQTFWDATQPLTTGTTNENDFMALGNEIQASTYNGPKSFPPMLKWGEFIQKTLRARTNNRGPLFLTITTNFNYANYASNTGYFEVIFDSTMSVGIPPKGQLECRIDGYLSKNCNWASATTTVTIQMPLTHSITQNVPFLLMISTRNADDSATLKEGLVWGAPGLFEITVNSKNSGGTILEYTKKTLEVYPTELVQYWAWSPSKMRAKNDITISDTNYECSYLYNTGNTENNCGLTFIRTSFTIPGAVLASNDPSNPVFVVEFARATLPDFPTGFATDLGTGLAHRADIPCFTSGLTALPTTTISCKLYYGTWPNPTRIFISNFAAISSNTAVQIHIPKIFNPNATLSLVSVRVRIQSTVSGKTNPLYEAQYNLVNTTYQYPTQSVISIILTTLTSPTYDVTFANPTINTLTSLNIKFISQNYDLDKGSVIVFEIPQGWQLINPCSTSFGASCDSYSTCNWVVLNLNAFISAGTPAIGTIGIITPPFAYIVPSITGQVKAYIYAYSKLLYILAYPLFSQTLTPATITTKSVVTTDNVINDIGEYTITATIPNPIPANGAIRIKVPSNLIVLETSCRNDVIAGSTINNLGFSCSYDSTNHYYIIQVGNYGLAANQQILIKANFQNPSTPQGTLWGIETFYLYETPLNMRMCMTVPTTLTFSGPSIVNPSSATVITYLDNQHRTQNRLHVSTLVAKTVGPIQILVQFTNAINHNPSPPAVSSWYIKVTMSSSFTVHAGGQIHATWNYNQAYFTTIDSTGTIITIYAPKSVDIAASTYYFLNLTTLNANDGNNGFNYPTTQGSYPFTVTVYDNTNTLRETGTVNLFVPGVDFTLYSSSSMIINAGYYTIFNIKFKPQTLIPSNGYLIFYVPTVVEFTLEALYSNDLGSGLNNGDPITCSYLAGFTAPLTCILTYGNQNAGTPASIKISGFTAALSTGTLYSFRIQNIKNPTEALLSDTKHVYTRLESYDASNNLINSGICYDFTIATISPIIDLATVPTIASPTCNNYGSGSTGVKFTLTMQSPNGLYNYEQNDYFILEFPKPLFPTIATTTQCVQINSDTTLASVSLSCSLAIGYNWVIVEPSISTHNVAANIPSNLVVDSANQALYASTTGVQLKGYAISKRILRAAYYYNSYAMSVSAITMVMSVTTPDIETTLVPSSSSIKYMFTITVPSSGGASDIPVGGLIDIVFPTTTPYFVLDNFCQNDISSDVSAPTLGGIACTSSLGGGTLHTTNNGPYFSITGFNTIAMTKKIVIWGYAKTPSAAQTLLKFSVYIYADTARTQPLYSTTSAASAFPDVQAFTGFQQFSLPEEIRTPYVVRISDQAIFRFQIILGVASNFYLRVSFPTAASVSLDTGSFPLCYFGDYEAASCRVTTVAATSLAILIQPPNSPALTANTVYTITIDSTCGTSGSVKHGLKFGASGTYNANVEISTNGVTFPTSALFSYLVMATSDFTLATIIMPWANSPLASGYTYTPILISLTPSTNVPTGGKIVISFPITNYLRTSILFDKLGYNGANDGDTIDCFSASPTTLAPAIVCKIYYISSYYPHIEVTGFNSFSAKVKLIISKYSIPILATDDGFTDIRLHTEDASGNILNERVIFDVISPISIQTSPIPATGATGVSSFTFSNTITPLTKLTTSSGGRIVFEFPLSYSFGDPCSATLATESPAGGGTLDCYNNIILYNPTTTGIAASLLNIGFGGITNMFASTPVNIYVVENRAYTKLYKFAVTGSATPALTVTFSASNLFANNYADYLFKFTPGVNLPIKSIIQIVFSTTIVIDRIQIISGLTTLPTYTVTGTTTVSIVLTSVATTSTEIDIQITVKNPITGTYNYILSLMDSEKNAFQTTTTLSLVTTTLSLTNGNTPDCIASISETYLTINLTPTGTTATSFASLPFSMRIYGLTEIAAATGTTTTINGVPGTSWTFDTTSQTSQFYKLTSTNGILSTSNTIVVSGIGTGSKSVGFSLLVVICVESPSLIYYEAYSSSVLYVTPAVATQQFTSSIFDYGNSVQNEWNYFKLSIKPSTTLTYSSTSTGIYLSFSAGFAADLGYALNTGDYVPCYISGSPLLKCVLSRKDSSYQGETKIYLQNFGSISSTSSTDIWFYRITNPSATRTEVIRLVYFNPSVSPLYDQILAYFISEITVVVRPTTVIPSNPSITASPTTFQSVVTTTQTITLVADDKVTCYTSNTNGYISTSTAHTTPTLNPSQGTCTWYSIGQMIFCNVDPSYGTFTLSISNFENPWHFTQLSSPAFSCYSQDSTGNVLTGKAIVTNSVSYTNGAFTGVISKALDPTNLATSRYYFELIPASNIPKGGCLEVTFTGFTSAVLNGIDFSNNGNYEGSIFTYIYNGKLYFKGFDYFYGLVDFKFTATISGGGISGTSTISLASYAMSPENIGPHAYLIDSSSSISTITFSTTATSVLNAWNPTRWILGYTSKPQSSNSFISFKFAATSTLMTTSNALAFQSNGIYTFSIIAPLRCRFNEIGRGFSFVKSYSSLRCFISSDTTPYFVIEKPKSASIAAAKYYEVMIFMAETNNQAGFQLTSSGSEAKIGLYYLTSETTPPTTTTIIEYNTVLFKNFLTYSSNGCVKSMINTFANNNLLHFELTLSSVKPYIEILLPLNRFITPFVTDTLYTQNLGTGSNTRSSFYCNLISGFGATATCTLWYGQTGTENRPSRITIHSPTSTFVSFDISYLTNPTTTNMLTNAIVYTYSLSAYVKQYNDFYYFPFVTYTTSYSSVISQTGTFPTSFTPLTTDTAITSMIFPITTANCNNIGTFYNFDGFLFKYDTTFYDPVNTPPTATITGVTSVTNYFMTIGYSFVITNDPSDSITTNNIVYTNLKTPPYAGGYTGSWIIYPIVNKVIVSTITYQTTNFPIFTGGTFFLATTPAPISDLSSGLTTVNKNTLYTFIFHFKINFIWDIGTAIRITFPTGFVVSASAVFTAGYTGTYSVATSGTNAVVIYGNNVAVASGTTLTANLIATTPSTGPIGTFLYECYLDYPALTKLKATFTSLSALLTINAVSGLNQMQIQGRSAWVLSQQNDIGPIEFQYKPASSITKLTGYLTVVAQTSLWSTVLNAAGKDYDDLKCFWGNMAASQCWAVTNGFQIWAPASNTIATGTSYVIYIGTNRAMTNLLATNENYKLGATANYNIDLTPLGGTKVTNVLIIRPPDFTNSFINAYITTISQYGIFYISLTPTISIANNATTTPGQILIEFPTASLVDTTLFANDLGTGYNNGEIIDCYCNGCPAVVMCTLNTGANSVNSPTYIIISSKTAFPINVNFQLKFPKLKLPTIEKMFIQMRVVSRLYTAAGTWTVQNELVFKDNFYTTVYAYGTTAATYVPTYSLNFVGQPSDISFDLTINVGTLQTGYDDRFILETTTSAMVFEQPPANYRANNYAAGINVGSSTITLYSICKWIEIIPSAIALSNQLLTVHNLKNMPYQFTNVGVASGITFNVYVWKSGDLRQIYHFPQTVQALPNTFISETLSPYSVIILQPTTYTLVFQPYNRIPTGGKILIQLPDVAVSGTPQCDFVFFDAYCTISGGIPDASCDIVPGAHPYLEIKQLTAIYDPFPTSTSISVSFYAQNPSMTSPSCPGTTYFKMTSYYDANDLTTIMDVENTFDTTVKGDRYIVNGGNILTVTVADIMQNPHPLCAGYNGPLILYFQFSGNLAYPNDYINIDFKGSFSYVPNTPDELICYFTDLTQPHVVQFIKTFRCDYNANVIQAFIPEEMTPFLPTSTYQLTIYTRNGWGLRATTPSAIYWAIVSTTSTNDNGWIEVRIPACPFDGSQYLVNNLGGYYLATSFHVESFSSEASKDATLNPTWNGINFTLTTQSSPIPTGDIGQASHSRILVEFPTNNELSSLFDQNLGVITSGDSTEVGCGGQYKGAQMPLNPDPLTIPGHIQCTAVQAAGTTDNSTPAYVMFNYYEAIPAATKFNIQITKIANPATVGTFSHITIRVQSIQQDGTWYDIYYHVKYFLVVSYFNYPNGGAGQNTFTMVSSGASIGPSNNYVTKSMGNVTYLISSPLPFSMNIGDIIVFEYSTPYILPTLTNCVQMISLSFYTNPLNRPQIGCGANYFSRWVTIPNTLNLATTDTITVIELGHFINPNYEYQTGPLPAAVSTKSVVNVYIWQGGVLKKGYTFNQSPTRQSSYLVLQTSDSQNDVNKVITYSLGVILGTATSTLKYLRIFAPLSFPFISNCVIKRGLVLVDMTNPGNPIKCVISTYFDPVSTNTVHLIEIYNFGTYNGDGWLMISLDITNPSTPGWTSDWSMITYASQPTITPYAPADLTMIQDDCTGTQAETWVGALPYPNLFRVYRNTVGYRNRKASLGDYAEVDIRLIPKTVLPPTQASNSAWVEVWMPDNFDIPNGGTSICEMGQNYHTDITGQYCQISSDRKITMYTNSGQGLGSPCNLMTWTTTGAIGGDGVKLPDTPTTDGFEFYEYINNNLVEYSIPGITTQPEPLTVLTFDSTIKETYSFYIKTVYSVVFQSNIEIPAGYDTTPNIADPLLKSPIGYITYDFNTVDKWIGGSSGYAINLGNQGALNNVPCRAIQGLTAPSGESIKCIITPVTTSGYFNLVRITVSNFLQIDSGTTVEIRFLELKTVYGSSNDGHIMVGAFVKNADGTTNDIILQTSVGLTYSTENNLIPNLLTWNLASSNIAFTPSTNYVGAYTIMDITFPLGSTMAAGGYIVFRFPLLFELKYQQDSDIQAAIDGFLLTTTIYASNPVNEIYFTVPTGHSISLGVSKVVRISQIRNMAYEPGANYQITLLLIQSNGIRLDHLNYINVPAPTAGPYAAKLMVLSSYFSGDVNVLYSFSITPTYRVPASSTIQVNFPNWSTSPYIGLNYLNLPTSSPTPICTVTPATYIYTCNINSNQILITTSSTLDMPENTAIQIQLSGVRNPTYVGPTVANDYNIVIETSGSAKINTEGFPSFIFLAAKSVNVLYMNIEASSLYQSVSCDYIFSLQPSTTLPAGGQIFLQFPAEWASATLTTGYKISGLTASFSSSVLTYAQSYASGLLTLTPNFVWPSKSTLYIAMDGLVNPSTFTSNDNTTSVFQAYTEYDTVKLDQTDVTDIGLKLTFLYYNPTLTSNSLRPAEFYPQNEGEIASYSFTLNSSADIPAGSQIELQFSSNYDSILSTYDKGITCYSSILGDIACTVSNGKIIVPITQQISANPNIDLQIKGIMNPNQGSSGSYDIVLRDGSTILSYEHNSNSLQTTTAPQWLNMTFLNTTSTNLQQKSNYSFCVETYNPIPLDSSVLIDFPPQFSLRQSSYACHISTGHNATTYPIINGTQTPNCTIDNQLRTFNISGQITSDNTTNYLKRLCYEIDGVENPSDSGESGNFGVSIYSMGTKQVLYETYGVLSYPSTLTYSRQGLTIVVGDISSIYVGTMSLNIPVTLQRAVSYEIYLTPSCTNFAFLPANISFFSYLPSTQYFMIIPLTNATLGQNKISWTKLENTTTDQFSEVADSFFTLLQNASSNVLKLTISPIISRTALRGTSLPIKITLSVAPVQNMTVYYAGYKPTQTKYLTFSPQNLVFGIGETSKTFTYTTYDHAVSGSIQFWLDSTYASKYTMNTNVINFEILDVDHTPPKLLNYYIVDMDRTYMYFRISTSESGWVKYLLTNKGTLQPPNDELQNNTLREVRSSKTNVTEINGSNYSYQSPVTKDYIYYDTYLYFSGLEEQTDYVLFFLVEDLSGNGIDTVAFPFRTLSNI